MRKCCLLILLTFLTDLVLGASVEWNTFSSYDFSSWQRGLNTLQSADDSCWVAVGLVVNPSGSTTTISGQVFNPNISLLMVLALAGETFSEDSLKDQETPFISQDGSTLVGHGMTVSDLDSFYLAFVAEDPEVGNKATGWVELMVEGSNIFVKSSAVDLDAGAMTVGGGSVVPEPTSGLLLLLGVAALGLRRNSGEHARKCNNG